MKKLLQIIVFAFPLFLFSQSIDEEFLDTLPDEVREDIVNKMDVKQEIQKPVYSKASTRIDKEEDDKNKDKRKVFGHDFFDTLQTSFMPTNEPNLDSSYILDFGDVLQIQLVGQENNIDEYVINRDGSVNLPDVGKIYLSGLSLDDASSFIKSKISNSFIGTEAYISLTSLRDISILIAGNAYNPGIYTLNGNSNMLHAISLAGGVDDIGSYRNINLVRNGVIIDNLDVYYLLIYGKSNTSRSLRSGDTIIVNPVGKLVSVESGVRRPGLYELKDKENFNHLISFANGIKPNANLKNISIKSIEKGNIFSKEISFDRIIETEVIHGDSLFINEYVYNTVEIRGGIENPGFYTLPIGTSLSELIEKAGGYKSMAYPLGGFLNNKRTYEINSISKDKLYDTFLNNFIRSFKDGERDKNSALILEQLRNVKVTGRIIAEFDVNVIKANPELDTMLEDGDEILIPNITKQVYVQGDVGNPGSVRYSSSKDILYYIDNAGGMLNSADSRTIFVVHPNGASQSISSGNGFSLLNNEEILIYPGSIIYVPKSTFVVSRLQAAAVWAPIVSSIALSLTSLSVLGND